MAAITSNEIIGASSAIARPEDIRAAFTDHKEELTWLAEFLTDDELMASACLIDARTLTDDNMDEICGAALASWPRDATICSALDFRRMRISELAWVYEHRVCCRPHRPLSLEMLEFVVRHSDAIRLQLDSLCRFVLIVCGVEQRSASDAALLLGISKHVVEVAYSRVLQALEVMYCEEFLESYGNVRA